LLAQYSVLFTQILDDILLPLIHPTGQHDHNKLKGIEGFLHRLVIVSFKIQRSHVTDSNFGPYDIEAAIASVHATARGIDDTDWGKLVLLYDSLLTIRPSPIVALNRAIAIAQRDGPARGIEEIRTISDVDRLASYPFYWATLGEFELRCKRCEPAQSHFRSALTLARNEVERHFFTQRLHASEEG